MIFPVYTIIGTVAGLIAIIFAILRFKEGKMSLNMLILWILIWIGVIIVSINPQSTVILTSITGITRGLDAVLIFGLFLSYYIIFRMYTMIESMEQEITRLVRELALHRGDLKDNSSIESQDIKD